MVVQRLVQVPRSLRWLGMTAVQVVAAAKVVISKMALTPLRFGERNTGVVSKAQRAWSRRGRHTSSRHVWAVSETWESARRELSLVVEHFFIYDVHN